MMAASAAHHYLVRSTDIINWKQGEWGRCPQAGGFTLSTPKTIFNLIAPSYLHVEFFLPTLIFVSLCEDR